MARTMTPQEVAAELNLDLDTIYKMLKERRLPAGRAGRKWIIDADVVRDFKLGRLDRSGSQRLLGAPGATPLKITKRYIDRNKPSRTALLALRRRPLETSAT